MSGRQSPSGAINHIVNSQVIDPASVPANDSLVVTYTITGARTTDIVAAVDIPAITASTLVVGRKWVNAADTVMVELVNPTAVGVDLAASPWSTLLFRTNP